MMTRKSAPDRSRTMRCGLESSFFFLLVCFLFCANLATTWSKKADPENKPAWAKKDVRDMDDADLERLLDQWEEDEEPLPEDELPEYKKPPNAGQKGLPSFEQMSQMKPDDIMKLSKKGKTLMMFVSVSGNPTRNECEEMTSLWQGALRNNHIQAERYVVADDRAIFLFHDGAQAWDAKVFLLEQDRLKELTLEGQVHKGKNFRDEDSDKTEL